MKLLHKNSSMTKSETMESILNSKFCQLCTKTLFRTLALLWKWVNRTITSFKRTKVQLVCRSS